jgi:hypothetical protein
MSTTTGNLPPIATILAFPRRRGRPKSARLGNDTGTPELVMKRLHGETAEALDLCLERRIISREQHWCGVHLRWLYTLRHGAPGVRAIDTTHISGLETRVDDPEWRSAREKEYHEAMKKLTASGHALMIANLCIYNIRPKFLAVKKPATSNPFGQADMVAILRDGLDVLVSLWKRTGDGK